MEYSVTDQIVQRCLDGDEAAFAEIVDHHKLMVFNLVHRMIHDEALADDLSQEVFLRVYRGLSAFQGKSKLSTWIYRIAYRVCLEESERAYRRHTFVPLDEDHPTSSTAVRVEDSAFSQVDARESVEYWLSKLPPNYRMAINLYYLHDRSYREIADVMGIPEGTVKTYLHRAKEMLKAQVKNEKDGCYDL